VQVPPSTPEETLEILAGLKGHYEKRHNVRFSEDTLKFMVKQADRFIHTNVFPDKAIDLLDEAGAIVGARMDAAEIVEKAKLVEARKAEFDLRLNLFYEAEMMTRIDMSEYGEQHSVARLIGAPPGYVGFDQGGMLTESVRRKPYQVVLLDEIEKAHPKVWNVLLQVLDAGRLTDGQGTEVDFRNVIIIIMTSNIGAKNIVQKFREFLPAAGEGKVRSIIDNLTHNLRAVAKENGFELDITEAVKDFLIEHGGFDPEYGARPMRRTVQTYLEDTLTDDILLKRFASGDKVRSMVNGDEIVREKVAA
jgi:ATP-dependent Clp protease ATP-binding subunit ClpA